jgi:Domain of unknown function (DUF4136)
MRAMIVVVLAALVSGCAGIRKTVNFDETVGFREYERYEWATDAAGLEDSPEHMEIRAEFDKYLRDRGYERVRANPDFLVHLFVAPEGVDFPAAYRTLRYRPSRNLPINLDGRRVSDDALIFDVIDRDSRELVWRGVATRVFDAKTGDFVRMPLGVKIIMRDFPPG